MNRIHIGWNEIGKATDHIANQVKEKLHVDYVVGIALGGLVPAVILSHKLDVPLLQYFETMKGNILLVDDISDTGFTLKKHCSYLKSLDNVHSVITATIHVTPNTNFTQIFITKKQMTG